MFKNLNHEPKPGEKFFLVVSEPWDFSSPAGENLIEVFFVKSMRYKGRAAWLLESTIELEEGDLRSRYLLAVNRYKGESLAPGSRRRTITVNVGLVPSTKESEITDKIADKAILVLSGDLQFSDRKR